MKYPRLLFAFLVVALLSLVFFLVGNHIVTSGRLTQIINSATHDLSVHYTSASGSLLTHFRFKDLEVKGSDDHVIWDINIKDAVVAPSLWRLLFKTFQTSELIGSGFSFRLEFKEQTETQKKWASEHPDPPDSYKKNWHIRIADIQLDQITDIEIDKYALHGSGNASLQASFAFWPQYELEIEPSRFRAHEGAMDTDFKFRLDRVRFQEEPGFTFFHKLTCELAFKGESRDLGFLNYYFQSVPWLGIEGSGARLHTFVDVQKGVVNPLSKAELEVDQLSLRAGRFKAVGSGSLHFNFPQLSVHFGDFHVLPIAARGQSLDLNLTAHKIDLADPVAGTEQVEVRARHVAADGFGSHVEVDGDLHAGLSQINSQAMTMKIPKLEVDLKDLKLSRSGPSNSPQLEKWWGQARVSDAEIQSGPQSVFRGMTQFSGRDGKPLFIALKNAGVIRFNLAGLVPMHDLDASSRFKFDRKSILFDRFHLQSSTLQGEGQLEIKEDGKFGALKIKNPIHSFEIDFLGKETKVKW